MHSALPVVDEKFRARNKKKNGIRLRDSIQTLGIELRDAPRQAIYILALILFLVIVGITASLGAFFSSDYSHFVVRDGSATQSYTKSPFIYPDLSRYSEYKLMQSVSLDSGRKVNSAKHSILYRGSDTPSVVMVTGFSSDAGYTAEYLQRVLDNRLDFAKKHGHGLYIRYLKDFQGPDVLGEDNENRHQRAEFAKLFLIRKAMFAFPDAQWIWWLDQDAIIKNSAYDIKTELLAPNQLEKIMLRDQAVIPPESVIHTYRRVRGDNIRFIVSQNDKGLATQSFIISNDMSYGQTVIELWMDRLFREYHGFVDNGPNQFHAIDASLTHIVQWHPIVLSRMAVIPSKFLGSHLDDGEIIKGQNERPFNVLLLRDINEHGFPGFEKINQLWLNNILGVENPS